jgi:DNA-binding LacI/PurR family transcriptional regulator
MRTRAVDVVRTADAAVVEQQMQHLLALRHRDIAHVDGGQIRGAADRRRCYKTFMRRHGLEEHTRIVPGGMTEASGVQAAQRLLREGQLPTAVTTFDDRSAVGLLAALLCAGVDVPGQISVVGYDDARIAAMPHNDLTTVGQDAVQTALRAVERAVARLDGQEPPGRDILVPPYLVVRGTTAAPRVPPSTEADSTGS